MVLITATADRQYEALLDYYLRRGRGDAALKLEAAFNQAVDRIAADPLNERPPGQARRYPGPYPAMERHGFLWIYQHIYWFAYAQSGNSRIITNVMWDRSDMPAHVSEDTVPIGKAYTQRDDGS